MARVAGEGEEEGGEAGAVAAEVDRGSVGADLPPQEPLHLQDHLHLHLHMQGHCQVQNDKCG